MGSRHVFDGALDVMLVLARSARTTSRPKPRTGTGSESGYALEPIGDRSLSLVAAGKGIVGGTQPRRAGIPRADFLRGCAYRCFCERMALIISSWPPSGTGDRSPTRRTRAFIRRSARRRQSPAEWFDGKLRFAPSSRPETTGRGVLVDQDVQIQAMTRRHRG